MITKWKKTRRTYVVDAVSAQLREQMYKPDGGEPSRPRDDSFHLR